MKPFNKEYILNKINEYNIISNNEEGKYKITHAHIQDKVTGYLYNKNEELNVKVPELLYDNKSLMKIDVREVQGAYQHIKYAKGKVGIVGLGLGYTVQEIAKKSSVREVIVYEISEEVVELYKKNFGENKKIKIIIGDAYKAKKESFDFFYVDIYEYELSEKVVDDYISFHKIHDIKEYSFWGVEHFLLSCRYEEIVWVYVPEMWMEMSKNLFSALSNSGNLDNYYQLDAELVSNVLKKFKEVLNEE